MQTKPLPEIDASDLRSVRNFLISSRDEDRRARAERRPLGAKGNTMLRNGIVRARMRSLSRTGT